MRNDPVNLKDPTGKCPNCISGGIGGLVGGLGGAAGEALTQIFVEGKSLDELDGGRIASSALSGAISGAITGATGISNPVLSGAVEGAITSVASDLINGRDVSLENAAKSSLAGAVGSVAGDRVTKGLLGKQRATAMSTNQDILSDNGRVALGAAENSTEAFKRTGSQVGGASVASTVSNNLTNQSDEPVVVVGRKRGFFERIGDGIADIFR